LVQFLNFLSIGFASKQHERSGSLNATLSTTFNAAKATFAGFAQTAMMLLLIVCATSCCGRRESSSLGNQILRLQPGQMHQAKTVEVWHSAERYSALEQELINCAAALKQRDNK
jgi:hypothetical protein